ncbi:hypothetical protein [Nocardia sp. No.11]|uniref:hypothetical protein n=1 Tax=Nocardia sp. No.11 TaxID=3128861 RepID=UPI00319EA28A
MANDKRGFHWIRTEIERLDPEVDSERIVRLTSCQLLPKSLLAVHLFYTVGFVRFAGPPVSAESVDRNGTGMLYGHGIRRADETMFHLFSWVDDGVSSPTSVESLGYVRNWHSGVARNWPMPVHTFQHSAAVFTLIYDRLLRQVVGAPGLSENERRAQLIHWRGVSEHLGVTDIPGTWRDMEQFLESYEYGASPCSRNATCCRIRVRCSGSATSSPSTSTRHWSHHPSRRREPHRANAEAVSVSGAVRGCRRCRTSG